MIKTFQDGKDIYATIASIAFHMPYEECLEFHPDTHEYQPDGKARRGVAKVLVLGLNYGMSVESIAQDLYGNDDSMTDEQKTKEAQKIFDAVMNGFPHLRDAILDAQHKASTLGYTETILGRRRHHPNMQLPPFEFKPMAGYMNPDVDPLDPSTLTNKDQIPERIVKQLTKEFNNYKYYGQIVKRTKALAEEKIKVINNTRKITEASRQCWNAVIQGSAADLTKLAMLRLCNNEDWKRIGGRLLIPVHDELIVEVPYEFREEGARILKESMEQAGSFLPFKISCDIEETFRWYGLSVDDILSFDKPVTEDFFDSDLSSLTESNICWLQCMLIENEFIMPVYKEADGSKPIGLKAKGVNGVVSDELKKAILTYKNRYRIQTDKDFVDHIERKVIYGQ